MTDDEHIKRLARQAIDEAFMAQIAKLFEIWCIDPIGQPQRAATGARNAIAIYKQAIAAIEKEN